MKRDETTDPNRRDEELLRQALREEAAHVPIGVDGLDRIRQRTAEPATHRWWRPVTLVAATAAAAGIVAAVVLGDEGPLVVGPAATAPPAVTPPAPTAPATPAPAPTTGGRAETPAGPPAGTPTVSPTPTAEAPAGNLVTVPAYYATTTDAGLRLAREFRATSPADDPLVTALEFMVDGPVDPDYVSLWNPLTEIRSATDDAAGLTVDLSADAEDVDLGAEAAELAVQQLVYTVTAAAQRNAGVRILVEGQAVDELLGHVDVSRPVNRADPLAVRQLVQINDPGEGAQVGSRVRVTGEAAAFEANVPWRLLSDGDVVQESFATAAECCRFAPFSFELALEPGTYELIVSEDDPSGGEGRPPMSDSKTFTVTR